MIISPITSIEKDDVNDLKEHTKRDQGNLWYRIFTNSYMSIINDEIKNNLSIYICAP